jgi:hypothetical protein
MKGTTTYHYRGTLRLTASMIVVLSILIRKALLTKGHIQNPSQQLTEAENNANLELTICDGFCTGDCASYVTPIAVCFSPKWLFPKDPLWGEGDILDIVDGDGEGQEVNSSFSRTIFESSDGTCRSSTDNFIVPLDVCVGPFDKPRPWGTFKLRTDAPTKSSTRVLRGRDRMLDGSTSTARA